jgi:hypothetical protein
MFDQFITIVSDPLFMVILGFIAHFLKEMVRIQTETKTFISPLDYFLKYPYQTILGVIGCLAGMVLLNEMQEVSAINGFALGYMADSAVDIIGKRGNLKQDQQS